MSSPFSKQHMSKSPIAALSQKQETMLPENLKTAIEAKEAGSPVKQSIGDKEPSIMEEKKQPRFVYNPKSDELNEKQRDSLNTVARDRNEGFYSPEFDVSVDPEDGVLTNKRNEKHPDFSNYHFQIKE